jgi:ElaB/YqjD/DUF883 family membrane-anchored ribosome-binding protein
MHELGNQSMLKLGPRSGVSTMAKAKENSPEAIDRETVGQDIAQELRDLRADFAALVASLQRYGALGAADLKESAQDLSDEAMAESLRKVQGLRRQVDALQSELEGDMRAHPLAWLAGALGIGMLFGLLLSHRH